MSKKKTIKIPPFVCGPTVNSEPIDIKIPSPCVPEIDDIVLGIKRLPLKAETLKEVFNYLKENLVIDVDCHENWGYYENGSVSVDVNVSLRNPETGNMELISSGSCST